MANKILCFQASDCPYLMPCFVFSCRGASYMCSLQQLDDVFRIIHQINSCPWIICIQIMTFSKLCFFLGSELPANAGKKQEEHRGSFLPSPPFQDSSLGSRAGKRSPEYFLSGVLITDKGFGAQLSCVASTECLGFASTGSPEPPLLSLTMG